MDWDARYSIDDYLFGKDPAQALLRNEEHLVVEGNTLVIADGEGRNSVYLAKKGFKVTATDNSTVAHQKAKALANSQNVEVNYKLEDFFEIRKERDISDIQRIQQYDLRKVKPELPPDYSMRISIHYR